MDTTWTDADTAKAKCLWENYRQAHDLSDKVGQTVGIDPKSGRLWFGQSGLEVVRKMRDEGFDQPLFFLRVGSDTYLRKGARR